MNPSQNTYIIVAASIASALGAGIAVFGSLYYLNLTSASYSDQQQFDAPTSARNSGCNVQGVVVHGEIVATRSEIPLSDTESVARNDGSSSIEAPNYAVSNEVEYTLRDAARNPDIKAVLIDIDSPGGGVVASGEIADAIKNVGKPSVALIHEVGASGGYMAASAADSIIASSDSTIGSIGVTSSYISQVAKDQKDGYSYEQLSSGPFKDMMSPDKPLTAAERALEMRDINILRDHFVQRVADNRHLTFDAVSALADGSTMLGGAALENKLIDKVGGTQDALDELSKKIGEPASVCW